ncbi:MAG: UDP-N-acetylmuramoylalanine--D-glutamate ligase, partial [Desulfovibrio sp.]|nr:UDP-N-acetylmuramoylalanine--D-glutamate ligase [Desulfovibrio sp.]
MTLDISRGRRVKEGDLVIVVGAGRSGRAATELLLRQKARVRLLEKNAGALAPEELSALKSKGVEVRLGEHSPEDFTGAAFVVPSPGMPVISLAAYMPSGNCTAEIIAEMELAWRYLDAEPVIAVTGTSGKTTTASLAASMLQAQGY